ncbi:MAG: hypothetical protein ACE5JZ_03330 [Kiloniellales bacterium]
MGADQTPETVMPRFVRRLIYAAVVVGLGFAPPALATQIAQTGSPEPGSELQVEILFWESIKDSTDPGDYRAYLETYPNGRFAALARHRLRRYAKETGEAAPPATTSEPTAKAAATTATGKPVYVPKDRRGAAAAAPAKPKTYVARTRAWVYRKPTAKSARTGEFFVEAESFKVTELIDGGRWLKVITRSGKEGYIYGPQARELGSTKRGTLFMNPDQAPTQ